MTRTASASSSRPAPAPGPPASPAPAADRHVPAGARRPPARRLRPWPPAAPPSGGRGDQELLPGGLAAVDGNRLGLQRPGQRHLIGVLAGEGGAEPVGHPL